ncbi:hypothetical protein AC1031_004690 [Aphanomyces cochlioides]|nr:hypothetical protein AC1031_004690 [Aphanomyces cochlioides]
MKERKFDFKLKLKHLTFVEDLGHVHEVGNAQCFFARYAFLAIVCVVIGVGNFAITGLIAAVRKAVELLRSHLTNWRVWLEVKQRRALSCREGAKTIAVVVATAATLNISFQIARHVEQPFRLSL